MRYLKKEICQFLRAEERLNAELMHGHYDNFFDSEEEWLEYELEKLREYITDYKEGKSYSSSSSKWLFFNTSRNNSISSFELGFIDNQTKATQVSQYELMLHKDSNWKIVT